MRKRTIKKTPRLYKYNVKMVQKVKENRKRQYNRKKDKQNIWKEY